MSTPAPSHYEDLWIHRLMLRDRARCEAFRAALRAQVRQGDVVLDVGAGTGILSLFAAEAGAARVYAIEPTRVAEVAREVVRRNGAAKRVVVLRADVAAAELPERVDVIVSDWLGGYGVDENLLAPVLTARDRWLAPGGRMIPGRVTAYLAPVSDPELDAELEFWRGRPYSVDLEPIGELSAHEVFWSRHHLTSDAPLAEPLAMWTTELATCAAAAAAAAFRADVAFDLARDGRCSGLAAWFRAELGGGATLTNAPGAPKNHWGPFVFPLTRPIEVARGTRLEARFTCSPAGPGRCNHHWSVRVAGGAWEHHTTLHALG